VHRLEGPRRESESDRGRSNRDRADDRSRESSRERNRDRDRRNDPEERSDRPEVPPITPYQPGEFEQYVQSLADTKDTVIERFGARLIAGERAPVSDAEAGAQVPPDYVIGVGDDLRITLWGSVEGDLRQSVDRSGRIHLPRVGPVMVSGARLAELNGILEARVAKVFKNFKLNVSIDRLRTMRVYVTGYAQRPGAYTVTGATPLINAVMLSGGPTAAGSFRRVELRRPGTPPVSLDLYDLLIKGDRSGDRLLQPEDVIHFTAVGEQVALIGSVNSPAVFELRQGETLADLLAMGGGFTAVADRSRLLIERLSQRSDQRVVELALPQQGSQLPRAGDVVRAVSAITAAQPQQRQNKRVRIEGEVLRPGEYILPPGSTLADAVAAAGGLTPGAFPFGTEFTRESVRVQQEQNFDRALRDLENELVRTASTQRATTAEEASLQTARQTSTGKLVERMRTVRPTGRIVLQLAPNSVTLPPLALEDGDRLVIPNRPSTVGVFGSVFNAGSFVFGRGGALQDFLQQAGGPTRGADVSSTFVVRANGSVVSTRQTAGWISSSSTSLTSIQAEPGDTIFVPEELNKSTFVQSARDWTQIFYQFGLGAAGLKALKN
jgi:protein involved in polysaccharide export with SLBB domain